MADNQLMNMERDCVEELRLIIAPSKEGSQFVLYDDDGKTNDFEKGFFRKTTVSVSGTDVVKVDFTAEGDYRDTVKSVTVEIIRKDRSPFWAALGGQRLVLQPDEEGRSGKICKSEEGCSVGCIL